MRRRALVGLAGVLPVQAAFGQAEDMKAFRAQALRILRRKYPEMRAAAGKEDSAIIEIEAGIIDLTNVHATARQLPVDQKEAAIIEFLERLLDASGRPRTTNSSSWAAARKLLRPRLVPPDMRLAVPDLLLRGFAPGALIAYVLDHGQQVQYVARPMLASWGVDSQAVHDTAIAILEALSESIPIAVREAKGGGLFTAIATGDSYDAARLALPRFRIRLLGELGSPMFVGIPNRDFLVAWSADNAQFTAFVDRVVEDVGRQPYPITETIFHVGRDGVRPATADERRGR